MKQMMCKLSRCVVVTRRAFLLILVVAHAGGFTGLAHASTAPNQAANVAQHIQTELQKQAPMFKVSSAKAVALLDNMLVQQYGARGHLMTEPDATLKPGFYQAATLLMNGYPIAGGTLVNVLRQNGSMSRSPSGPALGAFVDAMLSPTGEDDAELLAYQRKSTAISQSLDQLPENLRLPVQVMLLGEVYDDAIAARAGQQIFEAAHPTPELRAVVEAARQAAKDIPVPAVPPEVD